MLSTEPWAISRRLQPTDDPEYFAHETITYPFEKMTIKTHIHPFPMIYDLVTKIRRTADPLHTQRAIENLHGCSVQTCLEIVDEWMALKLPPEYTTSGPCPKPVSTIMPPATTRYQFRHRVNGKVAPKASTQTANAHRARTEPLPLGDDGDTSSEPRSNQPSVDFIQSDSALLDEAGHW